ncbi:unnamed protein product [Brassica oleracea]|uniref:(rape) hypothetical protein n=1 Tax=Brassica napus TaxID=3708 RepID=A0A816L2M0_BRANA|nr:unnamed protein product [Brassica napus]
MSQGILGNAQPTIFNRETVCDQRGEVVREIEFVAHSIGPAEADAHWVALCNVEEPPPEPWVPVRPFSERVIGKPSRCTLPFLGTVRSFLHNPVPPFPEDLCVVRNLLHGGPLCWGLLLSREGPCCGRDSSISFQLVD